MKKTYFHLIRVSKKFVICIFLLIVNFQIYAQNDTLGWQGEDIIPLNVFTDSSRWIVNSQTSLGDSCYVTTDDSCTYIHWKFGSGNRSKFAQCYLYFNTPLTFGGIDIFGIDIKGSENNGNRNIQLKFEDGSFHAPFKWDNLAGLSRWCERISVLKSQFGNSGQINWNSIQVVSFEVCSDASDSDILTDSGVVVIKNFIGDTITSWERATSYEVLEENDSLEIIKNETISAILNRQNPNTGLFTTWEENNSTYLYGQGLVLKMLSLEGQWENSQPIDSCALAAERLAMFLINNQDNQGFWPRAWNSETGNIIQYVESDNTIWMGDFPWIITGLQNYYKKSCDNRVKIAINKAKQFLYNLIDSTGKFYTISPFTQAKTEVLSTEAYAAAILSLQELNDNTRANLMLNYIDSLTWNDDLYYWEEAIGYPRVVLFANTWLSAFMRHNADSVRALKALSLAGNVLYTRGPGDPYGLDGVGPVATWYEGTLSYICSGGPGSNFLFKNLIQYRNPDGTVPHYNDSTGSVAGMWSVDWSSLDGTTWLYFAASKQSPFDVLLSENCTDEEGKKVYMHYMGWFNDSIAESGEEINRHWNCGTKNDPKIGKYDSRSWPVLTYHMLLSWSCGIDGLIINVKDEYDHKSANCVKSAIKRIENIDSENFQYEYAISYDDQGLDVSPPFDTISAKFSYLRDSILSDANNNYIHYYNRPTLFVYNYNDYLSVQDYRSQVDDVFSVNKPLIIWNEIRESEVEYIDASYPWVQPAPYDAWDETNGLNWGKGYLDFYYNQINSPAITTKLDFACGGVWAGFNDTSNTCWGTDVDRWMDRRNGVLYDSTWSFVHGYQHDLPLRWVIIETWNDFNEGSEIEPTKEEGYDYLISTINNINEFKDTSISADIQKFEVAEKIYQAADSIYSNVYDSVLYYPILERAIRLFLQQNYETSEQTTDTIIEKIDVCFYYLNASFDTSIINGCDSLEVEFINNSSGPGNIGYEWDFGDSGSSTEINPVHYFCKLTEDTSYVVNLITTSDLNCVDTTSRVVAVGSLTKADFNAVPASGISPLTVDFENISVNADTYSWNFGNGDSSTNEDPSTIFTNNSNNDTIFNVQLTASLGLCADTLIKQVTVNGDASSIKYLINENKLKVYPVPVTDFFHIEYILNVPSETLIDVYDLKGNKLNTLLNRNQAAEKYTYEFDSGLLEGGIVILKVVLNGKTGWMKVIKN